MADDVNPLKGNVENHSQWKFSNGCKNAVYSPALNCIIASTDGGFIEVLDIHCGQILAKVKHDGANHLQINYQEDVDKIVVCDGIRLGCRGVFRECVFLESILQTGGRNDPTEGVKIELDLVQAGVLLAGFQACQPSIQTSEFSEIVEKSKQVLKELEIAYEDAVNTVKDASNVTIQWVMVNIQMDLDLLYSVFSNLMLVMKWKYPSSALPVVGDILYRLVRLQGSKRDSTLTEKSLMFSEVERYETFAFWPHRNYRWALPEPMSEAGFYHPFDSEGAIDRVMCFTCNVCLVCWEPSDQPWSEHERHSSTCPFVTKLPTENVTLAVCSATDCGQVVASKPFKVASMTTSDDGIIVIIDTSGTVLIYRVVPVLKLIKKFSIGDEDLPIQFESDLSSDSKENTVNNQSEDNNDSSIKVPLRRKPQMVQKFTSYITNSICFKIQYDDVKHETTYLLIFGISHVTQQHIVIYQFVGSQETAIITTTSTTSLKDSITSCPKHTYSDVECDDCMLDGFTPPEKAASLINDYLLKDNETFGQMIENVAKDSNDGFFLLQCLKLPNLDAGFIIKKILYSETNSLCLVCCSQDTDVFSDKEAVTSKIIVLVVKKHGLEFTDDIKEINDKCISDAVIIPGKSIPRHFSQFFRNQLLKSDSCDVAGIYLSSNKLQLICLDTMDVFQEVGFDTTDGVLSQLLYCPNLCRMAACFHDGTVCVHDFDCKESEDVALITDIKTIPEIYEKGGISDVMQYLQFCPIPRGLHLFAPVNWAVESIYERMLPDGSPSKLSHRCIAMRADLTKGKAIPQTSPIRDDKFHGLAFHLSATAESYIAYLTVNIGLKEKLSRQHDILVKLHANQQSSGNDRPASISVGPLLCGPISLKSCNKNNCNSIDIIFSAPQMMVSKVMHFVLQLEEIHEDIEDPASSKNVLDLVLSVTIGVYQFATADKYISSHSLLIQSICHSLPFLQTIVDGVTLSKLDLTQNEMCCSFEFLILLAQIKQWAPEDERNEFLNIIRTVLSLLMEQCFVNGNRSLAHRMVLLIHCISSYEDCKEKDLFMKDLIPSILHLLESIDLTASAGPMRWLFYLLNTMTPKCNAKEALKILEPLLIDLSSKYQQSFSHRHRDLQERFGVTSSLFNPTIFEPQMLRAPIGNESRLQMKASQQAKEKTEKAPQPARWFRFTGFDVLGLLEVKPLFTLIRSTSDGAQALHMRDSPLMGPWTDADELLAMSSDTPVYQSSVPPAKPIPDLPTPSYETWMDEGASYQALEAHVQKMMMLGGTKTLTNFNSQTSKAKTELLYQPNQGDQTDGTERVSHQNRENQLCLLVERMHVASHHFVTLEFPETVRLTDVFIPRCSFLSRLTLLAWKQNQDESDAETIAVSSSISYKALALEDCVPAIECKFIKIIVVGNHSQGTSRAVISLGQFYGHPITNGNQLCNPSKYFNDAFWSYCRFSYRLSNLLQQDSNLHPEPSDFNNELADICQRVVSSQVSLATAGNSQEDKLISKTMTSKDSLSQDKIRLLIECILQSIELLSTRETTRDDTPSWSLEICLNIFSNLCIYGPYHMTKVTNVCLFSICKSNQWWPCFLAKCFEDSFSGKYPLRLVCDRVFSAFMQLIHYSVPEVGVIDQFIQHLSSLITSITKNPRSCESLHHLDWLLLLLNDILRYRDQEKWMFITPWKIICPKLRLSKFEIKSQAQSQSSSQKATAGQKQKSNILDKSAIANVYALVKNQKAALGWKIKDPSWKEFTDKVDSLGNDIGVIGQPVSVSVSPTPAPTQPLSERKFNCNQLNMKDQRCIQLKLSNDTKIMLCKMLVAILLESHSDADLSRALITCKILASLPTSCSGNISLHDIVTEEQLSALLCLPLRASVNHRHWIQHAIMLALNSYINSLPVPSTSTSVGSSTEASTSTKQETEVLNEREATLQLSEAMSSGRMRTAHQLNLVDHFGRENTFKIIEEDLLSSVFKPSRTLSQITCYNVLIPDSTFTLSGLIAEQLSMDYLVKSIVKLFSENIEEDVNGLCLQYCYSLRRPNSELDLFIKNVIKVLSQSKTYHQKWYYRQLFMKRLSSIQQKVKALFDDQNEISEVCMWFSSNCDQISNTQFDLQDVYSSLLKNMLEEGHDNENRIYMKRLLQEEVKRLASLTGNQDPLSSSSLLASMVHSNSMFTMCCHGDELCITHDLIQDIIDVVCNSMLAKKMLIQEEIRLSSQSTRCFIVYRGCVIDQADDGLQNNYISLLQLCLALLTGAVKTSSSDQAYTKTIAGSYDRSSSYQPLIAALDLYSSAFGQQGDAKSSSNSYSSNKHHKVMKLLKSLLAVLLGPPNNIPALFNAVKDVYFSKSKSFKLIAASSAVQKLILGAVKDDAGVNSLVESGLVALVCQRALLNSSVPLSQSSTTFSVIQNELNKQERFYAEFVGEADTSPRPPKRNDGLQNFAPYSIISGPTNCDPLDVLTKAKTSHRRIRFAAFTYKLPSDVDPWIKLNIELPCVISVKEISIIMHQSYIGGCPSKVKLELSVDGEQFVPYSPIMLTSGRPVIKIVLASGELAKVVRLCLRAPVDLSYKLNLIEVYGGTALSVEDHKVSSHEDPASLKWMEVLCAASDSSSAVLTEARRHLSQDNVIKSMRLCLNSLDASQRWSALSLFVDLLWCPVNESNPPLLAFDKLLPIVSNTGLIIDNAISSTLLQELLLAYIDSDHFSKKDATTLAHYLGLWTNQVMKTLVNCKQTHGVICQYLSCVIKVLEGLQSHGFDDSDNKEHKIILDFDALTQSKQPLQLSSTLTSLLGLVLNGLSYFQPDLLHNIVSESTCDKETILMIVSHACQSEGNVRLLLSSKLPSDLCSDIIDILSKKLTLDWFDNKSFHTLGICLNVLSNMFYSSHFVTLFGNNDILHHLWEVLMVFLDSVNAYKLHFMSELHLEQLHILQDLSVTFFNHSIGRCHSNEVSFCQTLIRLLWKRAQSSTVHQKTFLEHLLSQLVIEEQDVKVTLIPKQPVSPFNHGHLRTFQMKIKETSTIGQLQDIITPSSTNANQIIKSEDAVGWSGGNIGPDYCLYAAGMAGLEKRKKTDSKKSPDNKSDKVDKSKLATLLYCNDVSPLPLSPSMLIYQLILSTADKQLATNQLTLEYEIVHWQNGANECSETNDDFVSQSLNGSHYQNSYSQHSSLLDVFAEQGGLRLFAMNYCDLSERKNLSQSSRECLCAIGQLLLLPGYDKELLKRRKETEIILRLMLEIEELYTRDKTGKRDATIDLVIVPYLVLNSLLANTPLGSLHGQELRHMAFDNGILLLVLQKLASITSENTKQTMPEFPTSSTTSLTETQDYWAKGTGFGTGSTTSNWNVEKSILRRKREEEHIVALLSIISSFINPCDELWRSDGDLVSVLPNDLSEVCFASCLKDVLSNFLRNDSVLDMSRHVPLYRAVMGVVKAIVSLPTLVPMVLPTIRMGALGPLSRETSALTFLLTKMKRCIDTYTSRLKAGSSKTKVSSRRLKGPRKLHSPSPLKPTNELDESQTEQLTLLIEDINSALTAVQVKVAAYKSTQSKLQGDGKKVEEGAEVCQESTGEEIQKCIEADYISKIKELQFDTYEIVTEDDDGKLTFSTPYYYQQIVRSAKSDGSASRARRIAQEVASLSTSLPLSYGSSVFLRCDENRLDVMKVLITGPEDTPYANGCFEFDVYFPVDYPASPMMVNLHTTGQHSVRFNPNLYNDGKVCLSILNTWHGRPEEKWNPETSNLLQVLVSMQSLILVPDPYFNEPGYERSRGTKTGTQNSNEYNANIRQATVKWAMLEQLKKPSACFKEILQAHFKAKSKHIIKQVSSWIETTEKQTPSSNVIALHLTSLRKHFELLKHELKLLEEGKMATVDNHPSTSVTPIVTLPIKLEANDETDSLSESYDSDPSYMFL